MSELTRPARGERRPNILWIVTTQWRAQATRYAGDPNARTPALDALAAEAVNFSQAVTPHPFGPFARAALLTGVASPENGVTNYFDPLPKGSRTIAHDLEERGYATAFFGKWHLADRDPSAPLVGDVHAKTLVPAESRGGFALWEGFESGFLLNDPWLHGTRLPEPQRFPGYQSDVVCGRSAEWIERRETGTKKPWFCVVSLEAPHPPYDAPANGVTQPQAADVHLAANVPRGGNAEAKARAELAGYYAHIEATDRAIGGLVARLKAVAGEMWDDTLVVFTSVHGDMHGAHGLFRKGWPHEESVRVPLLVKPARGSGGNLRGGERWVEAVSLADLPAITRSFADGELFDFGALRRAKLSMPSVVALPLQCDRVWSGIRTATRKLIVNADGSPWLFFDLQQDPGEMRNLAAEPGRSAEMRELLTGL